MTVKSKRSEFKTFMNTTPSTTATYSLVGDGVTSGKINYNPKTTTEQYIHQDSASTETDSYAPVMPLEITLKVGDAVCDYLDGLRQTRVVGAGAKTDVVNVWLYETPTSGEYPAEKQNISLQWDDFGGAGGESNKFNATINYDGDPVFGTFNPTTKVFTPNP